MLKVCMIGLGSIGKRHLSNLEFALKKRKIKYQIDALRSGHSILPEKCEGIICRQYNDINDLPDEYDVIFVTNPTSMHYETIKSVLNKTKHIFIEKPVFDSLDYHIAELGLKRDSVYYVACPLRHKGIMKYVKEMVDESERVISARIISSSYLPSWRKGVDYREIYSAKKNLGGGVTKDLIHEWDYAIYLFGKPEKVLHIGGHLSGLEIDSDDISVYIARYPNMVLEMHLDYIGQKTERKLQLFTDDRRVDVDLVANAVKEYKGSQLVYEKKFPEEDFYLNEIEYFLDCIEGKQDNINTINDAYNTLKVAMMGEGE